MPNADIARIQAQIAAIVKADNWRDFERLIVLDAELDNARRKAARKEAVDANV